MSEKLKCEIAQIDLNDATFKETGASITPTYINYFFGNNGTGKTTIANAIKTGVGISYAPGKSADDFQTLVYDQDFITANMQSYHHLPGVFTINERNVEIQGLIDEKNTEYDAAQKRSSDAAATVEKKKSEKADLLNKLYQGCWDTTAQLRASFVKTQDGKKRTKQFTEEVKKHTPVEHDLNELKRMYDSVYSDTAKAYNRFNTIDDTSALDDLPGNEVLAIAIVNTANTPFAEFLKTVGSTEWVRQGHAEYHDKAGTKCPYCSRELPGGFEKLLADSFDTQYQTNLEKLNDFLADYTKAANDLFVPLQSVPDEIYPAIDIKTYNEKLAVIQAVITANINKIKDKVEEPSRIVTLDEVASILQDLSDIIKEFNRLIEANNDIVAARSQKRTECVNAVFEHLAFVSKDLIKDYSVNDALIDAQIKEQQKIISEQEEILAKLASDLSYLKTQTVETETAMNNINTMLRDSGFQGFKLCPIKENLVHADGTVEALFMYPQINYAVVRTDTGEVAENLSEGEKNFIAFLYFQEMVFGSDSQNGDPRGKIVVIDDPVSSMDSSALFIVAASVRKMIEICRNNADSRNPVIPGNFIKQIFILTHNAYFHREITYAYANRYDFVSFYLIRKMNNKSSVKLCDIKNPDCPTERMNINPVKNSYAALWEEYKEVTSSIPLMSTVRRILEYYFLQICGYEGGDLRKRILEENKDSFTHDDDGNEDYTKYDMASSMLSYISASSIGVNDGMNYVDDCVDIQQCRETFRMIFHHMGQDQHYEMMMGIK